MDRVDGSDEVRWAPRLGKSLLRRLYENDAAGIVDEELVDEVGYALYLRCQSIVDVEAARRGRVRCPRCERNGVETWVARPSLRDGPIVCDRCGWATTWPEYSRTFRHKQLNSGGALSAFEAFLARFRASRSPGERVLAVDRLIHEFHYSLRSSPTTPTRAVAVNLIRGRLTDVMEFLDELTRGPATGETYARWMGNVSRLPWRPPSVDPAGRARSGE